MTLLLTAAFYLLAFGVIQLLALGGVFDAPGALGIAFSVVAALAALVLPFWAASEIQRRFALRAAARVGRQWCRDHGARFVRAEMHKNHFAAVYEHGSKQARAKFRMQFAFTTWAVKRVEWLDKKAS